MDLVVRPLQKTLSEYSALAAIHLAAWGEIWLDGAARLLHDEKRNPDFLFERLVAEVDRSIVGHATYGENAWNHQPGKYELDIVVHPDWQRRGIGTELYHAMRTALAKRTLAPTLLTSTTREDQPGALALLRKAGFTQVMRSPMSRLAVQAVDPANAPGIATRLEQAGITLHCMRELKAQDPEWKRHWYDLEMAINLDHPMPDHGEPLPYETFAGYLETPLVNLDGAFFALDRDGNYVGQSTLEVRTPGSDTISVGMTGVIRSHRRQGIATALKLRTIAYAQAEGIKWIQTSNEENNPMFHLNLLLGFQPAPAWLNFEKRMQHGKD
ncbi:MAG: GNAT family N-acetyltransferase [Caldilineaceae bacterium]